MAEDTKEGISNITWSVYGKILSIQKAAGTITYTYDASGNRITKTYNGKTTWYVRDASGNVMSIYNTEAATNSGHITQTEVHLYGSSRLGIVNTSLDVDGLPGYPTEGILTFTRGNKFFELTNHLGNVLVTITDKHIVGGVKQQLIDNCLPTPKTTCEQQVVSYYVADVVNVSDYYPFGMMMPGRKYSPTNSYRYGFNGKEKSDEISGDGNVYDYGFRIYNPRLGRFLSVDPLTKGYPELTPYQFASNTPIQAIDLDGGEAWYYLSPLLGWQQSKLFAGPYSESYANKLGFVSANQIPQIEEERARRKETIKSINHQEAQYQTTQAWNNYVKSTNLFYQVYALSPAKSGVDAYNDFGEGDYGSAAVNTFFTLAGMAELKALGVFGRSAAASIGWGEIWQSSNFLRGTLAESKLARTVYKGYEHLASTVSEFFPAIDFYKDGLGVSLKTVNAKSNFKFEKIFKNIDDLAAAKRGGALQAAGQERKIKDVRLDIAIPQGYDKSVLKKIEDYGKANNVPVNIFEVPAN